MKYLKDDKVYYNNNPAKFITYLSEDTAVIIVSLLPDFENAEVSGHCAGCLIGDSDNKLSCTCDEVEFVLETIQDATDETNLPLIVSTLLIHDKPVDEINIENKLIVLNEKRSSTIKELNELKNSLRLLKVNHNDLQKTILELETNKNNYADLEVLTIKEFSIKLARSMSQIMCSENDSRSIEGGQEKSNFNFNGLKYEINVTSNWSKDYAIFTYQVDGIGHDYEEINNNYMEN